MFRAKQSGRNRFVTDPLFAPWFPASVVNGHLPLLTMSRKPLMKIEITAISTGMLKVPVIPANSRYARQSTCHQNITEWTSFIRNSLFNVFGKVYQTGNAKRTVVV